MLSASSSARGVTTATSGSPTQAGSGSLRFSKHATVTVPLPQPVSSTAAPADKRGRQRLFQSLDGANTIGTAAHGLTRSNTSAEPLRQGMHAMLPSDASLSTGALPPIMTITTSRGLPFPMEQSASSNNVEVGSLDSWAEDDSRKERVCVCVCVCVCEGQRSHVQA